VDLAVLEVTDHGHPVGRKDEVDPVVEAASSACRRDVESNHVVEVHLVGVEVVVPEDEVALDGLGLEELPIARADHLARQQQLGNDEAGRPVA